MLAGRGHVGLGERLEQLGRLLPGHAHAGVPHRELELDLFAGAFEQFDVKADFSAFRELDRVIDEVGKNLPQAQRVTLEVLGNLGGDVGQKLQTLIVCLLGGERGHGTDDFVQLEIGGFDIEFARLNLREIQNVVDDGQERGAGVVHLTDIIALLRRELGFEGEMREPDDGIHRRADFMTHVGEEHGLHLSGLLGLFLRYI